MRFDCKKCKARVIHKIIPPGLPMNQLLDRLEARPRSLGAFPAACGGRSLWLEFDKVMVKTVAGKIIQCSMEDVEARGHKKLGWWLEEIDPRASLRESLRSSGQSR